MDLWRTRPDGPQARRRFDRERSWPGRSGDDPRRERHRFRARIFCDDGDRLRSAARVAAPDGGGGAGAGRELGRRGDLSRRGRRERAPAVLEPPGFRSKGNSPPRRRSRARPVCADRAGRPCLSRLHLRLDGQAQGGAACPEGGDRSPADGARLAGAGRGRHPAARRQPQLDLCARRRRARSFRLRRNRRALCGTARSIGLAQAHRGAPRDDLRRRAEPLSPDPQIRRTIEISICRACVTAYAPARRSLPSCSPDGERRPGPGSTKPWA